MPTFSTGWRKAEEEEDDDLVYIPVGIVVCEIYRCMYGVITGTYNNHSCYYQS